MSMRAIGKIPANPGQLGRLEPYPVPLPADLQLKGQKIGARQVNLARSGALVEPSAILQIKSAMIFHRETVAAAAVAISGPGNRSGLNFPRPLSNGEVQNQLSRGLALTSEQH